MIVATEWVDVAFCWAWTADCRVDWAAFGAFGEWMGAMATFAAAAAAVWTARRVRDDSERRRRAGVRANRAALTIELGNLRLCMTSLSTTPAGGGLATAMARSMREDLDMLVSRELVAARARPEDFSAAVGIHIATIAALVEQLRLSRVPLVEIEQGTRPPGTFLADLARAAATVRTAIDAAEEALDKSRNE